MGFDKCRVDEGSEAVAMCTDPFNIVTIPLVFRQYTPVPSGLEYQPGKTYYFICEFCYFLVCNLGIQLFLAYSVYLNVQQSFHSSNILKESAQYAIKVEGITIKYDDDSFC